VIDASDNLFLSGQVVYDGTTGNFIVPAAVDTNASSFFLARLNTDGDVIWVERAGSLGQDQDSQLKVDNAGNLIAVGQTFRSFDNNTSYSPAPNSDYYLIKYNLRMEINSGALSMVQLDIMGLWSGNR
jgi:Na+-transporting NADH:ubiquinone oxidoreductase subunit NqrB